jgi:penicillin-binding protein 1C
MSRPRGRWSPPPLWGRVREGGNPKRQPSGTATHPTSAGEGAPVDTPGPQPSGFPPPPTPPHKWEGGKASRCLAVLALVVVAVIASAALVLRLALHAIGPPPLAAAAEVSTTVLDRHDRLLRAFTTPDGRWRLPVAPKDVDARYLALLMAFEDRRFWTHRGVDPLALARAAGQLVRHARIVSGASTLTMQVARLLDQRHERTPLGKLRQMLRAVQLESAHGKDEILALYLRLAPFGGNIEGVRAASLAYFGKEPRRLSVGEAALLVALPQSPEVRRPDRNPEAARRARDRVLERAVAAGVITAAEAARAQLEPVPTARRDFPKLAPHLAEAELARDPARSVHRLTLDRDVQAALEALAAEQTKLLGARLSAAILALDHTTGQVVAYVGSAGYLDDDRFGAVDMVQAVRSPGSALKPVIYGLAFEQGLAHPETLIEDRPVRFGSYAPRNFDDDFHGTVTIREALGQSLNVPAVKVLNAVGPARLVGRLRRFGLGPVLPAASEPTLAIALGGLGLRMVDLAALYAGLARGGEPVAITWRREPAGARPPGTAQRFKPARRLLGPVAAWYVTDILKDAPPPPSTIGGRIAYKTGTSYGYRDAWAIGYDGRHTIAVWVGRPDGASTPGLLGRTAAGPILFDAFARLGGRRVPLAAAPSGALRTTGAMLPPPLKRFGASDAADAGPYLDPPVLISFPPDRAELEIEAAEASDAVVLKAEGGALPLTWLVDGAPIASEPHRREAHWQPAGGGFANVSVIDARGRVDRVTVRLK